MVLFPITVLHDVRWLPYPKIIPPNFSFADRVTAYSASNSENLKWLRFYLPLVIYGTAFIYYGFSAIRKRISFNMQFFGTASLIILGVLLFAQALSRYDYIHVLPSSIIAFLVAIPLVQNAALSIRNFTIRCYFLTVLIFLVCLFYFLLPARSLLFSVNNFSPFGCYSHIDRASCVYINKDQEHAVNFIRTHTQNGESIFVGNRRHDLIFVADVGFYFLSDRPSATKYHDLFPGVATTRSVQEEIVHDIRSRDVNWIVLVEMPESGEPNGSAISTGVYFLDDYIHSAYTPTVKFGDYEIWKRATR
jgi:hypothetical protein